VHTLVTLGSPHGGSEWAGLVPVQLCRQITPDSDLLAELDAPAPNCRTRFIAYWSDLDQLILPHENACVTHPDLIARNIAVRTTGHMSLPIDPLVVHQISALFSELEPDGTVIHAGVTAIAS
jgi:hypothetical protein